MKTLNKNLNPLTEVMSFEGNSENRFIVKLYKKRNMYSVIVTDAAKGIKHKKIKSSTTLDECMKEFHRAVKIYSDRIN